MVWGRCEVMLVQCVKVVLGRSEGYLSEGSGRAL